MSFALGSCSGAARVVALDLAARAALLGEPVLERDDLWAAGAAEHVVHKRLHLDLHLKREAHLAVAAATNAAARKEVARLVHELYIVGVRVQVRLAGAQEDALTLLAGVGRVLGVLDLRRLHLKHGEPRRAELLRQVRGAPAARRRATTPSSTGRMASTSESASAMKGTSAGRREDGVAPRGARREEGRSASQGAPSGVSRREGRRVGWRGAGVLATVVNLS